MRFADGRLQVAVLCLAPLLTGVATAHHSTAEFDYTKQLTIHGKVKEVQWTNPHSYIQLLVAGDNGTQVEWSVEIGSPSLNINLGWRKNSVVAGDEVTMLLSPARNGTPYGTLRVLTFADGRELKGVAAQVGNRPPPAAAPAQSQ
jgi:phage-related protein